MILDEWVDTRWHLNTKAYYINLGYEFTEIHEPLKVRTKHLKPGSAVIVTVQCYVCGEIIKVPMYDYTNITKRQTIGYKCRKCVRGDFEKIHSEFIIKGLTPLFTEYINCVAPLEYICQKHPEKVQRTRYLSFSRGRSCKLCREQSRATPVVRTLGRTSLAVITSKLRYQLSPWVLSALKESNFTCSLTGVRGVPLEVHHERSFASIRDEALRLTNLRRDATRNELSEEQFEELVKVFHILHDQYTPKVMQKHLHKLFHKYYGKINNTPDQFDEFKSQFQKGWIIFKPNEKEIIIE